MTQMWMCSTITILSQQILYSSLTYIQLQAMQQMQFHTLGYEIFCIQSRSFLSFQVVPYSLFCSSTQHTYICRRKVMKTTSSKCQNRKLKSNGVSCITAQCPGRQQFLKLKPGCEFYFISHPGQLATFVFFMKVEESLCTCCQQQESLEMFSTQCLSSWTFALFPSSMTYSNRYYLAVLKYIHTQIHFTQGES